MVLNWFQTFHLLCQKTIFQYYHHQYQIIFLHYLSSQHIFYNFENIIVPPHLLKLFQLLNLFFFLTSWVKKSEFMTCLQASFATHLYFVTLYSNIFLENIVRHITVFLIFSFVNSLLYDKFLIKLVATDIVFKIFILGLLFTIIILQL